MANVFKDPKYINQHGYNTFPLDHTLNFSSSVGHLLPVFYHFLNPGDKFTCDTTMLSRLQPMETSAFANIKTHLDWFVVPISQLYKFFEQEFFGVNDIHTTLVDTGDFNSHFLYPNWNYRSMFTHNFAENPNIDTPTLDSAGQPMISGTMRLLDLLGYSSQHFTELISSSLDHDGDGSPIDFESTGQIANNKLACWFLAAYQRIYMSYYRNSDREVNEPFAYNLDYCYNVNLREIRTDTYRHLFQLRYRPRRKDFFLANKVSPLIGSDDIGMLGIGSPQLVQWLNNSVDISSADIDGEEMSSSLTDVISVSSQSFDPGSISVSQIESMFAYRKLLEVTRRAGKHIDAQILAHFGVDISKKLAGEAIYLGSTDGDIGIGEVFSTADTAGQDGTPLGAISGKGFGKSDGHISYQNNDEHAIVMCIFSAEPEVQYSATGLDRLNTYVQREDFYIPEYDNLGMQPLFSYEGDYNTYYGSTVRNSVVLGWNYRYWEQKVKYNRSCGAMANSLQSWNVLSEPFYAKSSSFSYNYKSYLVQPTMIDGIMLLKFGNRNPWKLAYIDDELSCWIGATNTQLYGFDPLIHSLHFNATLTSKMSTYGLSQL